MTKRVLLTGGASGIGAATLARLEAQDCELIVLDINAPSSDSARFVRCNLSDPLAIQTALAEVSRLTVDEPLDALVNVAGVATMADEVDTVAINFLSLRMLTERLLPVIKRGGSVVNVASTAGWKWREFRADIDGLLATEDFSSGADWLAANPANWANAPYHFSKRCAAAYTYRATELALPYGVRVNCVNPGVTETGLSPEFRSLVGETLYNWGIEQIGRSGTPDDIAEVIEFLAIGDCRWLNGQEIVVDGGYIAGLTGGWIDPSKAPA